MISATEISGDHQRTAESRLSAARGRVQHEGGCGLFWIPKQKGIFLNVEKGEIPKIRGTLFWGPYNKDPII